MEDVRYEKREGGGMRLCMTKQITDNTEAEPGVATPQCEGEDHGA